MRPLFFLLPFLLLASPSADAQFSVSAVSFTFTTLNSTAGTAPTVYSQAAPLKGAVAFRVRVQTDTPSTTFSGTGRLAAYHWSTSKLTGCTSGCFWRAKQLDCTISGRDAGQRRVVCGDYEVKAIPQASASAIAFIPEDVDLSTAGTVSVEVEVIKQ